MAWKKIAGVGIAAAAGIGMLISTVSSASAAAFPDQAFGLQVQALGKNVVAPLPLAQTSDGSLVKKAVAEIPARDTDAMVSLPIPDNAPLTVGALEAQAKAGHAQARTVNLNLGGPNGLITAKLVQANSDKGKYGSTKIVNLQLAGNDLSGLVANPDPNTEIGIPGILTVTLNEQQMHGDTLTVNAVHVQVLPNLTPAQLDTVTSVLDTQGLLNVGSGTASLNTVLDKVKSPKKHAELRTVQAKQAKSNALVDVIVSSATSGSKTSGGPSTPPSTGPSTGPSQAPTPNPVPTEHPVTG
jgi:hypothetical protein